MRTCEARRRRRGARVREALGCGARRCNARGREVLGVERGGGANGRVRSAGCRARRCEALGREVRAWSAEVVRREGCEVLGAEHGGAKREGAKCWGVKRGGSAKGEGAKCGLRAWRWCERERVRSAGCRARRCEGREREVRGVEYGGGAKREGAKCWGVKRGGSAKRKGVKCWASSTEVVRRVRARSAGRRARRCEG